VATSGPNFTLRVLGLLALVIGVSLWFDHHLGVRIADAKIVSMISAAVAGALGLLAKLLSDPEKAHLTTRGTRILRSALWAPLLIAAWLVALVLGLTLSSVTVVAEAEGKSFKAALTPGVEPRAPDKSAYYESENGVLRRVVPTNPFGRVMRLSVPGYIPTTLDVYPLAGRRVVLGTDMLPSPSVLLRLPAQAHGQHAEGTFFVVRRVVGDQRTQIARLPRKQNTSAFLFGRPREVPSSLRRDWDIDLEAEGVMRGSAERATMLKEWRDPTPLETGVTPEPGMTIDAELLAPAGVVASAMFVLGREPFQDVVLRFREK
jgi:hypothetical protein